MKTLLVTNKIIYDSHNDHYYGIQDMWYNFSIRNKINIITTNSKNKKFLFNIFKNVDGLIVSGGNDVYKLKKNKINKTREKYEQTLINIFYKKKPIIFICRGLQYLISKNKIKLYKCNNHSKIKQHKINVKKNPFMKNKIITTNSFHNYRFFKKPDKFETLCFHEDKSIEAIYSLKNKALGLMFHPERSNKSQIIIDKLIKKFLKCIW